MTIAVAPDLHALSDEMLEHSALDVEDLRQAGYLLLAVPVEFGGLGGNLVQALHQQRRLARRSPATARSCAPHIAWTGVAADLYRDGDSSLTWLLEEAAAGEVLPAGEDGDCPKTTIGYLTWTQCIFASVLLGIADRALELAVSETSQRTATVPQPRVQHAVAEMAVVLEGAWSLTEHVAHDWTAGVGGGERWMAKLAAVQRGASGGAVRVIDLAAEVTGGLPEIERLYQDACSCENPDASVVRELVGKAVLGLSVSQSP